MKHSTYRSKVLIAALSLALVACAKKDESKASEPAKESAAVTPEAPATAPTPETKPAAEPAAPEADSDADYVRILATHKKPKPSDPVIVHVKSFSVVKAEFDPANLEGATAEITLDLKSIDSGIGGRDKHLKAADYLDVDNTPQVLIKVSDVKKAGEGYEASVEVSAHGATKTMPVNFNLLKSDDTSVQIEASKEFDLHDFGISLAEDMSNAPIAKIEMRLTLKKS